MDQRKGQAAGGGLVMYEELVYKLRHCNLYGEEPLHWVGIICDAAEAIEKLQSEIEQVKAERETYKMFFDDVTGKPDCNDCGRFECEYKPKVGETTRFNCPLWRGMQGGK